MCVFGKIILNPNRLKSTGVIAFHQTSHNNTNYRRRLIKFIVFSWFHFIVVVIFILAEIFSPQPSIKSYHRFVSNPS